MTATTKTATLASEACEEFCICSLAKYPSLISDEYATLSVACFKDFFIPDFCRRAKCAPRAVRHFRRVLDMQAQQYIELGKQNVSLNVTWSQDNCDDGERRKLRTYCQYLEEDFQPGLCDDPPPRRGFRELWVTANSSLNALADRGQHTDFNCDFARLQAAQLELAAVHTENSRLHAVFTRVQKASRAAYHEMRPWRSFSCCDEGATMIIRSELSYMKEVAKWFESLTEIGMRSREGETVSDDRWWFWRNTEMALFFSEAFAPCRVGVFADEA